MNQHIFNYLLFYSWLNYLINLRLLDSQILSNAHNSNIIRCSRHQIFRIHRICRSSNRYKILSVCKYSVRMWCVWIQHAKHRNTTGTVPQYPQNQQFPYCSAGGLISSVNAQIAAVNSQIAMNQCIRRQYLIGQPMAARYQVYTQHPIQQTQPRANIISLHNISSPRSPTSGQTVRLTEGVTDIGLSSTLSPTEHGEKIEYFWQRELSGYDIS